jgi:hypothetical protein
MALEFIRRTVHIIEDHRQNKFGPYVAQIVYQLIADVKDHPDASMIRDALTEVRQACTQVDYPTRKLWDNVHKLVYYTPFRNANLVAP